MTARELLESHSVITPVDVVLLLIAFTAVALAWHQDRKGTRSAQLQPGRAVRYAVVWARWFFGAHALYSGPNYFLHIYPQMQMAHPLAGAFQHSMEAMGLFAVVKLIESVVGVCLVLNVYVPAAAIIELPITFTIFYLSVFVVADPRTVLTGPRELLLNLFLVWAYGGWMAPILKPRLPPRPLWHGARVGVSAPNSIP
jgi:riboflavin transporter